MIGRMLTLLAASALAMFATGCGDKPGGQPTEQVGAAEEWTAPGGAADESGYSRLDSINTRNAGDLGLAWSLDLPGEVTLEATPLMVEGTLYFTGSFAKVYAVDARTGNLKWEYDPKTWEVKPEVLQVMFGVNRGVAYEDGKIFFASYDCRLFALDAQTGKKLWEAQSVPEGMINVCTGAPRTMNGKVIIGNGGAEYLARGFVTAFDANTGSQLWRFYTVPGDPAKESKFSGHDVAAPTWAEGSWETYGRGGTVWNGMTFDPELNRVYIGVGNAGPNDPELRDPDGGDNLFIASIVALDADTGDYVWHYQQNPREAWDYKATPNIIAATLNIEGKPRDVLLHAPTNGFFYVLDRQTGKFISAGKTTEINWAKGIDPETGRPIENPDIRFENGTTEMWPGTLGGHNWQPMAYNPSLGLVYIPIQQLGSRFTRTDDPNAIPKEGFQAFGLLTESIATKPGDGYGYLVAWDPVSQKAAWRIKHPTLWNGGVLTTAGGLVFQGTADGWFNAYNGKNGERLWRFNAGLGIVGAPISYMVDGKQYVSILVGYGGSAASFGKWANAGWKYGMQPRRLLTFALGAKGKLPKGEPANFKVEALDDPDLVLDPADVEAGQRVYARCGACHGMSANATGAPAPDLRESGIALDVDALGHVVRDGPLLERGMPKFDFTDEEIRQLHAYIRSRARDALSKREKQEQADIMPTTDRM